MLDVPGYPYFLVFNWLPTMTIKIGCDPTVHGANRLVTWVTLCSHGRFQKPPTTRVEIVGNPVGSFETNPWVKTPRVMTNSLRLKIAMEIVDLPVKNGDVADYLSLPEGKHH